MSVNSKLPDRRDLPRSPRRLAPPTGRVAEEDRRQQVRYPCRGTALVSLHNGVQAGTFGILTDVSLNGCYIEMGFPLPVGSHVDVKLRLGDACAQVEGTVKTGCPGLGMGVAFQEITAEQSEQLSQLMLHILRPTEDVQPATPPKPPEAGDSVVDALQLVQEQDLRFLLAALLRILDRKGQVHLDELEDALDELAQLRASSLTKGPVL